MYTDIPVHGSRKAKLQNSCGLKCCLGHWEAGHSLFLQCSSTWAWVRTYDTMFWRMNIRLPAWGWTPTRLSTHSHTKLVDGESANPRKWHPNHKDSLRAYWPPTTTNQELLTIYYLHIQENMKACVLMFSASTIEHHINMYHLGFIIGITMVMALHRLGYTPRNYGL